jgi:hypothetical protein
MLRRPKLYSSLALAIFSVLLACLIAYRHSAKTERPPAGGEPQNAGVMSLASSGSNPAEAQEQNRLRIEVGYGNLPLSFEPNLGQTDPKVKYISHAANRTLWLTKDEAVLAVGGRSGRGSERSVRANESELAVLRMKFLGANTSPTIEGEARQSGTVNYFVGKPDEWRTKIPTYGRVRYRSLYPGIDLVFYGNNRELEYDLVVAPGADPGRIKLAMAGADEIRIDAEGNLVLKTSQGDVVQQKPKIYQRKGTTLIAVAGDYVITGKDEVGFQLGSYDRRAAVVIDPVLRYSTLLGGSSDIDRGNAIAVDSSNRAVIAGFTCSQDFPLSGGITPPSSRFCSVFVTKLDFTGSRLVFSTVLGDNASGSGVALDSVGNIYITGVTRSSAFPTTPGAFQRTFAGGFSNGDAFVTKLSPTGSALLYSTFLGGDNDDEGLGIAVDSAGNAYVTGFTLSKNFPTTSGAFQRECKLASTGACLSTFVTKLNSTGSSALYSTFLNGGNTNLLVGFGGIAVNQAGNAFVTGVTAANDFPTTAGSAQPVFGGIEDAFVTELSSSGSHLVYSTFLGGADVDQARAIALDSTGNAYVTGFTFSTNYPVKNAFQPHCAFVNGRCSNAFVTKLNPTGSALLYSTYLGRGDDFATGVAVMPNGQATVAGITRAESFPTTQTAFQRLLRGQLGGFVTRFDPAGKLIYSSYLGGNAAESLPAVALDRDSNAYVTGQADSSFPVTPGAFPQTLKGGGDAFVAKVVSLCALSTVNRTVTICSPASGSTVASPVRIIAGTTDLTPVKLTQVYLDGKKIYETPLSAINVNLPIAAGTHRLTVQGLDTASVFFKKSISITVSPH